MLEREGLAYLDSAATSQTPRRVIEAMDRYYLEARATVHRGDLPARRRGDGAVRGRARDASPRSPARRAGETVFTRNATEAINLVAWSWGRANVGAGDRDRAHRDGAPLQHRAVADARAERGRELAYVDIDRRRPARPRLARRGAGARAEGGRRRARLQRARHHQPDRGDRRAARTPPARSSSSTARRPCRTCRSTSPRSAPTSTPGPATRPTARPASACCTAAASCSRRCRRCSAAGT